MSKRKFFTKIQKKHYFQFTSIQTETMRETEPFVVKEAVLIRTNVSRTEIFLQDERTDDVNVICAMYNIRHKSIWKYVRRVTIGHGYLNLYERFDSANQVIETELRAGHTHEDIDAFFKTGMMLERAVRFFSNQIRAKFLSHRSAGDR